MTLINTRTFGVELEVIAPSNLTRAELARRITAAGVACRDAGYTHSVESGWKIVTDGSLRGNGMELVSPPMHMTETTMANIVTLCRVVTEAGCTVNRSCGLHVHVDARDVGISGLRKVVATYAQFESVIDSLLPPSRRGNNNSYLMSMSGIDMNRVARASTARDLDVQGTRYVKLNLQSFWRQGTVEFRHHSGTTDAIKVISWAKFCLRLVDWSYRERNAAIVSLVHAERPRNARLGRIWDLMASTPGGVTRDMVRLMLGRRTMPPMNRIMSNAGIQYRAERRGREEYYVLVTEAPVVPTEPITLATLLAKIECEASETEYWTERQRMLAEVATVAADRVARAPRGGWGPGGLGRTDAELANT